MSKKSKVGTRIGNFVVTKEGTAELEYLKVQAVSGIWNMKWRSDNEFYHFIEPLIKDENKKAYLDSFFTLCFIMCNGYKDLQFMEGFNTIQLAQIDRISSVIGRKLVSDEEDKAIIEEEKKAYEETEQEDK